MIKRLVQVIVSLFLMLGASVALAQAAAPAAQQEWWQALLTWLMPIVGALVTAVVGTLAGVLLRRWNINLQQDSIDKVVAAGVNFAEGKALSALNAGQPKTPGAEKLNMALEIAGSLITQYKLQELAADKLKALIEAKLGQQKVEEKVALLTAAPTVTPASPGAAPVVKIPTWAK